MRRVVGLMSGTSLDGVDAALVETDGERIGALGPSLTVAFEPPLRARLRDLLDRAPDLAADDPEVERLGRVLAERYADAVRALGVGFDLVGMHGQTILHRPDEGRTWQIGDAAHLADLLDCEVVHDFRSDDVRAGGQGAPLVPLFHAAMLARSAPASGTTRDASPVMILNLGGISNLTWIGIPPAGEAPVIVATDAGPGNALLDDFVSSRLGLTHDEGGALALAGTPDRLLVERLIGAEPFFSRPVPKSLDRLAFAAVLPAVSALATPDGAATLAWFSARAVACASLPSPPARVLVCGGGRHNRALMAALAIALEVPVEPVETLGWDGDALEAQCFAYLAMRSLRGLPLSLPGTTGVPVPTSGGRLAVPRRVRDRR